MKGVQCYELFGGIALKIHTFSFSIYICGDFNIDLLSYDVNNNTPKKILKCFQCLYFD